MTINKNVEKVLWMFSVMFITYLLVGSFIVSRNILDIVYLVILYATMIIIKFANRSQKNYIKYGIIFFGDIMLIDTHCHLSCDDDKVIKDMDGIMIASGCDDKTNKEVLELIKKYDNVFGTLGIHPEEIDSITDDSFKLIENNINNKKIVAIGEIGLDYYWTKDSREI